MENNFIHALKSHYPILDQVPDSIINDTWGHPPVCILSDRDDLSQGVSTSILVKSGNVPIVLSLFGMTTVPPQVSAVLDKCQGILLDLDSIRPSDRQLRFYVYTDSITGKLLGDWPWSGSEELRADRALILLGFLWDKDLAAMSQYKYYYQNHSTGAIVNCRHNAETGQFMDVKDEVGTTEVDHNLLQRLGITDVAFNQAIYIAQVTREEGSRSYLTMYSMPELTEVNSATNTTSTSTQTPG